MYAGHSVAACYMGRTKGGAGPKHPPRVAKATCRVTWLFQKLIGISNRSRRVISSTQVFIHEELCVLEILATGCGSFVGSPPGGHKQS